MLAHSSILAWRMHMDRGAWRATVPGPAVSRTWPSDSAEAHHVRCTMESSTAAQLVTARLTHRPKQELFLFYLPYILHAFILHLFHAEITLVFYFLSFSKGLSGGTVAKNPHANAGDTETRVQSLGWSGGRSLEEENGSTLQHSGLENPMDKGAWRAI